MPKYAYSHDEELYNGRYDTKEQAISDGAEGLDIGMVFYVGECVSPASPASYFDIEDLFEHVDCQDEYEGDHAYGWDDLITKEQKEEINDEVQRCIQRWLDKHGLNPAFFNIDAPERVEVTGEMLDTP